MELGGSELGSGAFIPHGITQVYVGETHPCISLIISEAGRMGWWF